MFKFIFDLLTDPLGLPDRMVLGARFFARNRCGCMAAAYRCVGRYVQRWNGLTQHKRILSSLADSADSIRHSLGSYLRNYCSGKVADR